MHRLSPALLWCFLFGNVVIGFGVLMVPGSLNDISHDLRISISASGVLITASSVLMCLSAPIFASVLGAYDRRKLLALVMLWYGVLHAVCIAMPDFEQILWLRVIAMLAPAIFTPQAAACVGQLAEPHARGRAITFIFLGWSISSVVGMPVAAWISEVYGWRSVFGVLSVLSFISAAWVWVALPNKIAPPVMTIAAWRETFRTKPLVLALLVTVISASGQFFLSAYFAPYFKLTLLTNPEQLSMLLAWFGACGLLGNIWLSRHVDRLGADKAVTLSLLLISISMVSWSLGSNFYLAFLVLTPWGLGMFATNSAQQARLIHIEPKLAAGSVALNTSSMYLGQAVGSAGGGWLIAQGRMDQLHWFALGGVLLAIATSLLASRATRLFRKYP
ncbi:MAG: MFS transporter [Burkholderiales bacterium]|nr:MFS transporter [Burkholderiales bacterium]